MNGDGGGVVAVGLGWVEKTDQWVNAQCVKPTLPAAFISTCCARSRKFASLLSVPARQRKDRSYEPPQDSQSRLRPNYACSVRGWLGAQCEPEQVRSRLGWTNKGSINVLSPFSREQMLGCITDCNVISPLLTVCLFQWCGLHPNLEV